MIHVGGPQLTQPLDETAVKDLVRDLCTWLVLRSPPHPERTVGTPTVPLDGICGFLLAECERCETEQGARILRATAEALRREFGSLEDTDSAPCADPRIGHLAHYLAQWFVREMFETRIPDFDPPWEFVEACVDVMAPPCPGASADERQRARDELTDYWPDYRPTA